jgi:hypothetical protein
MQNKSMRSRKDPAIITEFFLEELDSLSRNLGGEFLVWPFVRQYISGTAFDK